MFIFTNQIAGYEKELAQLKEIKELLLKRDEYAKSGVRTPKGILLFGPPGVGKTAMAKSIIGDDVNLVELRAADVADEKSNEIIVNKFMEAKENIPSILLIDEIDKIAGTSDRFFMESNDEASKILLQEFDAIESNSGVLIVATCNDFCSLHPALRRSGRFDREFEIKKPTFEDRIKIAKLYLDNVKLEKSIDERFIAKNTPDSTGADIECYINEASIYAISKNNGVVDANTITTAINRSRFKGIEEANLKDNESFGVAIHEAGHALITMLFSPNQLGNVTIVPQGNSKGHISIVEDDYDIPILPHAISVRKKYVKAKGEFDVNIALGGRCAEMLVLKRPLDGSSDDLNRANGIIMRDVTLECKYGLKYYSSQSVTPSIKTLNFASRLLEKYYKSTYKLLKKYRKYLLDIANALVDRKTLSSDEVKEICNDLVI